MLMWVFYVLLAILVLVFLLTLYCVYCYIGIGKYNKYLTKESVESANRKKQKFNIFLWLILRNNKLKGVSKEAFKSAFKSIAKMIKKFILCAIAYLIGSLISLIIAIVIIYQLNAGVNAVTSAVNSLFGKGNCVCYAKCTDNSEDDTKTAYELLFGPTEYDKLIESLLLSPEDKEYIQGIHNTEPDGKLEGEFIIKNLTDKSVICYRDIVGNNNKFRSGDRKNRTIMTDEELKSDLIDLLSDYKIGGRNPNCECCSTGKINWIQRKCLGEEHYVEGWTWEEIWEQDRVPGGSIDPSTPSPGGGKLGHATGNYTVTLDDGLTYYWYHQSSCTCAHNINHSTYGRYSALLLGGSIKSGHAATASVRGCSTYATAMAISNILDMEVTPYNIITDVLAEPINRCASGYYMSHSGTNGIKLVSNVGVSMFKPTLASRVTTLYGSYGLKAEAIGVSQAEIDDALVSKGGVVVLSIKGGGWEWYNNPDSSHFIVLRKKDSDGLYYCLNSTYPKNYLHYGITSDARCMKTMNIGVPWSTLSANFKNADAIAYWTEGGSGDSGGGSGGGTPPGGSGQIPDITGTNYTIEQVQADIAAGKYTKEDVDYITALTGEAGGYSANLAVAAVVINRARQGGISIRQAVTADGQFAGYNSGAVGKWTVDKDLFNASIALLRGDAQSPVGDARYFFGRVNGYDMYADPGAGRVTNMGGNIYYRVWGYVHNKAKANTPTGHYVIYDHNKGQWVLANGQFAVY